MSTIAIQGLYVPGTVVYQSHAAALAAHPDLPSYDGGLPKYWLFPLGPNDNPDDVFTIHNLHDANGSAKWGLTLLTKGQAAVLNIPPDPTNPTNAPVYPPSVPIPMTYPLPAGDTVVDTPFGIIVSDGQVSAQPVQGAGDTLEITMAAQVAAMYAVICKPGQ